MTFDLVRLVAEEDLRRGATFGEAFEARASNAEQPLEWCAAGFRRPPEARHYSCRSSGGGPVVLVDQTTEPIASLDLADA
jgi:hypothetical protein